MPISLNFNPADLLHITPFIVIAIFAVAVPLIDVFAKPETGRAYTGYISLFGIAIAFILTLLLMGGEPKTIFSGMLRADDFGHFFNLVFLIGAAFTALLAIGYFNEHGLHRGEFYGLTLMALSGMMLMGMASDLVTMFVALEIMSVAVYLLAAFQRHEQKSVEAALKYFLMGAFSTAFLLFGIAFLYGVVGNTNLDSIYQYMTAIDGTTSVAASLGLIFIIVGFAFKVAAVPFHMWTPDAYEGAPTVVTGFMAAAVKAAAFAAFLRIFMTALYPMKLGVDGWYNIFYVLAILTMTLGNVVALVQDNIKRMLAYSSIAHAGYLLLGFLTITRATDNNGAASLLFYLLAYTIMNLGAFGIVVLFGKRGEENLLVSKGWGGMGFKSPFLGIAMTIFMLSLAGMPPTIGFMGKFYIFKSAIDQGLFIIALIGILNSLISVYYYLRVIVFMYMKPEGEVKVEPGHSIPTAIAIVSSAVLVLLLGILPSTVLQSAKQAVASLF